MNIQMIGGGRRWSGGGPADGAAMAGDMKAGGLVGAIRQVVRLEHTGRQVERQGE